MAADEARVARTGAFKLKRYMPMGLGLERTPVSQRRKVNGTKAPTPGAYHRDLELVRRTHPGLPERVPDATDRRETARVARTAIAAAMEELGIFSTAAKVYAAKARLFPRNSGHFQKALALFEKAGDSAAKKRLQVAWSRTRASTATPSQPPHPNANSARNETAKSVYGARRNPTPEEFAALEWEVLPPGWFDRYSAGFGAPRTGPFESQPDVQLWERIEAVMSLGPNVCYNILKLSSRLYYVALFESVAVADSPDYGNALYWLPLDGDNWKTVLHQPKFAALRSGARRIVHHGDWKDRLRKIAQTKQTSALRTRRSFVDAEVAA